MIKKNTLIKKLASYSALAALAINAEKSEAQVVHHSFIPNDTFPKNGQTGAEQFYLDLNDDGTIDFSIAGDFYSQSFTVSGNFSSDVRRFAVTIGNVATGAEVAVEKSVRNGYGYHVAPVISSDKRITSGNSWFKTGIVKEDNFSMGQSGTSSFTTLGKWTNTFDKFVGLRIQDPKTGNFNYGWLRLSVYDTVTIDTFGVTTKPYFILKDYAVQTMVNTPILAGDTGFFKIPPVLQFIVNDSNQCGTDSVTIRATNLPGSALLQFYRNDFAIGAPTIEPSIIVTDSGHYSAVITAEGHSTSTNVLSIQLPLEAEKPTVQQNGNILSSSEAILYQWYLNDGLINGATSQTYTAKQTGYYQVMITDSLGCSNISDSALVNISGVQHISHSPKIFATNRTLYLQLDNADFINGTITVLNMLGQSVLKQTVLTENEQISLDQIVTGIYFVRLSKDAKQSVTKIFVQ